MTEIVAFAIFAALALGSAVVVVGHRNPVYSTLALVVTLLATAALFVLLGSPFLAALQVLLYTGAILVLFLFVIMLLNVGRERASGRFERPQTWAAAVGALVFFGALARLFWEAHGADDAPPLTAEFTATRGAAELLFSEYLLPFEMIGLLLLVALVAASWVARRPEAGEAGSAERDRGAGSGAAP
jgi:NADH-quinone oxidoreductase subunit J